MRRSLRRTFFRPEVAKSHEEDTITTHFDWKKQNPILLVDRWEDQTATEDTTATLQNAVRLGYVTETERAWKDAVQGLGNAWAVG